MAFDAILHKGFTDKQRAFVDALVENPNITKAAVAAGYSVEHAPQIGSVMVRQPAILAAIQVGIARDLAIGAAKSNRLLQAVVEDKSADLRLRVVCARDILNRAGHIAPKAIAQVSSAVKPLNEMSMTELRELADKLEDELSGRAKDVSSATAAPVKPQALEDIM